MGDKKHTGTLIPPAPPLPNSGRLAALTVPSQYYDELRDAFEDVGSFDKPLKPLDILQGLHKTGLLYGFLVEISASDKALIQSLDELHHNVGARTSYKGDNKADWLKAADFVKRIALHIEKEEIQQEDTMSPHDMKQTSSMADRVFCKTLLGDLRGDSSRILDYVNALFPRTEQMRAGGITTATLERRFTNICIPGREENRAIKRLAYYGSNLANALVVAKHLEGLIEDMQSQDASYAVMLSENELIDLGVAKLRLKEAIKLLTPRITGPGTALSL